MIHFPNPSDALMAELREKHGEDIREVDDGERVFILAKPEKPRVYLERMTAQASNEKKKLDAAEGLVRACCVYPDKETLSKVLADEPGLSISLVEPAMDLLGVRQLSVKKG